jgi:hypothetical protein
MSKRFFDYFQERIDEAAENKPVPEKTIKAFRAKLQELRKMCDKVEDTRTRQDLMGAISSLHYSIRQAFSRSMLSDVWPEEYPG